VWLLRTIIIMVVLVLAYVANQGLWRNRGGERVGGKRDFFSAIGHRLHNTGGAHPLKISASGGLPYWLKPPGGSPPQQATIAGLRQAFLRGCAPPVLWRRWPMAEKKSRLPPNGIASRPSNLHQQSSVRTQNLQIESIDIKCYSPFNCM
jgi:hypothetical protein